MTIHSHGIRCVAVLILFLGFGQITDTNAAETDTRVHPPPPLRIVVLPFQVMPDAATNDWTEGFLTLLRSCLFAVEYSEVLSGKQTRTFVAAAGAPPGAALDEPTARRIATASEADVVIWGHVTADGKERSVHASVARTGSESAPTVIEVAASSWADLAEALTLRLSEQLGRHLHDDDHQDWRRVYSRSDQSLQPLARLITLEIHEAPESDRERLLQETLKTDPNCEWAHRELVDLLGTAGREKELQTEYAEILRVNPKSCEPHLQRAWGMFSTDKDGAERELREALRVHRGCPGAAYGFWLLHGATENWKAVNDVLSGIQRDRPDAARTRILLSLARVRIGDRPAAFDLLEDLNRLPEEDDEFVELALLAASLGCGRFDLAGRELTRLGPKTAESSTIRESLASLQLDFANLDVGKADNPITRPRSFTSTELQAELERRLSPAERHLLVDPIERTPQIVAEAQRLTRGLSNAPTQSIALFAEVVRRGRGTGEGGMRTAVQALEASESVPVKLSCQEHAKLFVSLARAVGLEAWMVHVDRDALGLPGLHDCATIFLEGHGLLVDPTWNGVGLRHQEFSVLDDLQAISHQAMQVGEKPDPARLRAGLKLNPDDRWTQLQFVTGMARAGQLDEASKALDQVRGVSPGRWDMYAAAADLAMARREWKLAQTELLRAVALSPSNALVHARLVIVYSQLKDSQKIKEHLEAALKFDRGDLPGELRRSGQAEIEILNFHQRAQADDPTAVGELERLAGAGEAGAMYALARLNLEANPPRIDEGLAWQKKAAELGDANAQFDYGRNLMLLKGESATPEAVQWLTRAAEKSNPEAQYTLGLMFYEGHEVERDAITAVKWIILARAKQHAEAKYLLKEMELLLPAAELAEGRKRAAEFKPSPHL